MRVETQDNFVRPYYIEAIKQHGVHCLDVAKSLGVDHSVICKLLDSKRWKNMVQINRWIAPSKGLRAMDINVAFILAIKSKHPSGDHYAGWLMDRYDELYPTQITLNAAQAEIDRLKKEISELEILASLDEDSPVN